MDGISKVWPKWQAVEILGEGGFGKVYLAKRENMIDVSYSAIKVVKIPQDTSELKEMTTSGMTKEHIKNYYKQSVLALVNEIKLMESLKSASNIVGIEDYDVIENEDGLGWTIYIRMELLTNLSDYITQYGFDTNKVVSMAIDICKALEYCHNLKIIHRDIKPANIFVTKFNEYKLGDFGVSKEVEKVNATMSQKGTKSYMAPEMIRMENYDHTVDLYALGLTMYELLNHGRMPFLPKYPEPFFPSDREEAMLKRLTNVPFPDIEGLDELNTIIKKACHFDAKQRYESASEMKQDLQAFLNKSINIDIQVEKKDDDEKTSGIFNGSLFDEETNHKETIDTEKTIGAFGKINELFGDMEEPIEIPQNTLPYQIKCPNCKETAYLVFTHGYYDGMHVITTSNDKHVLSLKRSYETFLETPNKKAALKRMIEKDNCASLHHQLAHEYINSGSKKYAYEEFDKAYELDQNNGAILKDMALMSFEKKDYKQALEYIEKSIVCLNENNTTRPYTASIVYGTKAIVLQKLKKEKEALEALIQAFRYNKDFIFETHDFFVINLLTEASALDYLYERDSGERAEYMYTHTQLFKLMIVFGIGKKIYTSIFKKYRSFSPVKLPNSIVFNNHMEGIYKKLTLTKMNYISNCGLHPMSTIINSGIPYISFFEIDANLSISLMGNDIVMTHRNTGKQVKFTVDKENGQWIYKSLMEIMKTNLELGGK